MEVFPGWSWSFSLSSEYPVSRIRNHRPGIKQAHSPRQIGGEVLYNTYKVPAYLLTYLYLTLPVVGSYKVQKFSNQV